MHEVSAEQWPFQEIIHRPRETQVTREGEAPKEKRGQESPVSKCLVPRLNISNLLQNILRWNVDASPGLVWNRVDSLSVLENSIFSLGESNEEAYGSTAPAKRCTRKQRSNIA